MPLAFPLHTAGRLGKFSHADKYPEWRRSLLPGAGPTSGSVKTYPIFAVIEDKPCLVVGGGAVGERKVADLMAAGARVTVVSRTLTPELAALADRGEIRYLPEDFTEAQVEGMALVMAATDDPEVNASRERRGPGPGHLGQRGRRPGALHLHCPGPGAPGRADPGHQHRRRQPGPGPPVARGVAAAFRSGIRALPGPAPTGAHPAA